LNKNRYIITPYSNQALYLAKSIRQKEDSEVIVLSNEPIATTDILYKNLRDLSCEIINADVIDFEAYMKKDADVGNTFFLIGEDSELNCLSAMEISKKADKDDRIFLDAKGMGPELLIDSMCNQNGMYIRRINKERNLIYRNLYKNSLFDKAQTIDDEKVITVVIIGLDEFGMEMLKACIWCGQMNGYVLRIHVIDDSEDAEDRFYYEAPEVRERNGLPRSGEDYYEITFHNGVKTETTQFCKVLYNIESPSWIFVSKDSSIKNLETAIKCREIFARQTLKNDYMPLHYSDSIQVPFIQVVTGNDDVSLVLNENGLENYRKQKYGIEAIGNISDLWAIDNVCAYDLENIALKAHLKWGDKESFEKHEYNRRASLATAIHKKYRDIFYPDADVMKDILEHRRWNAYMRSTEGYSFGLIRDDLAKQHNCLIKYNDLSRVEKNKDKAMNTETPE